MGEEKENIHGKSPHMLDVKCSITAEPRQHHLKRLGQPEGDSRADFVGCFYILTEWSGDKFTLLGLV